MSRHADLCVFFESDGTFAGIFIVEDDGDTRFRDACLTSFVDQVLQILSSDGAHICYSEDKTYGIENI